MTASEAAGRTVYASYVRQYYVVLSSPRPFSGWLNASAEVPPPPPVSLDYVELAPVGWLVDGRIVSAIAVVSPVEARAVYRLVPLVNGTLGNGTAVYVFTPNATVVWPQTPSYSVERYYYVSVQPPALRRSATATTRPARSSRYTRPPRRLPPAVGTSSAAGSA